VEGEIDKLSIEDAGFINCVSVPNGAPAINTSNYSSHFSYLESCQEYLTDKKHIIAVDSDEPGRKLAEELTRRLGIENCSRVEWPQGCKDANDVLQMYGKAVLHEFIATAKPYPIEGVFTAVDVEDKLDRLYFDGVERGVGTGWPVLDDNFLVRPGEFTVVTGIPNSGKSNFIDALAVNLAKTHGWSFAVFSPENQPIEDHVSRIAEKYTGKPFSAGPHPRMTREELAAATEWISEHFFWILPDDDSDWSIDQILKKSQALVFQHGIRGLIIDPWNELEHAQTTESETQYISRALKRIRQFGRRYGIHIFVVVHPQKLQKQPNGNYPVPTLYDCAGSAHWRNKADNGLVVWRDFSNPKSIEVEIHIQKIRFRQNGKIGVVPLSYNRVTATYHQQDRAVHEIPPTYFGDDR
jgi:twinkle protein